MTLRQELFYADLLHLAESLDETSHAAQIALLPLRLSRPTSAVFILENAYRLGKEIGSEHKPRKTITRGRKQKKVGKTR